MDTAVIGAVGPDICVGVPPKSAAKKLMKIAPYNPALGPRPEVTPKARAKGNATIPAVNPPSMSPLRFEKSKNLFFLLDIVLLVVIKSRQVNSQQNMELASNLRY
jgi:hypothetical protein